MTRPSTTEERDRLLEHEYDGIREYDNPLPGWWVWLFVITIVFSLGYAVYYHAGPGPSVIAQYEEEMRAASARQGAPATTVAVTDDAIRALAADAKAMAHAREIFTSRCAPCHGPQGQGVIGPNLTDDYWLHGGRPTDILRTITDGVPDKGMLSWKAMLQPEELRAMAAYVGTLHGTNPPNPKPPQGVKVTALPGAVASRAR